MGRQKVKRERKEEQERKKNSPRRVVKRKQRLKGMKEEKKINPAPEMECF